MFTELAPLLEDRTLLLTLSAAPGGIIRVNVIPKCRNDERYCRKSVGDAALCHRYAAELDRDFPAQLTGYAQSILETDSTLNQIRESSQSCRERPGSGEQKGAGCKAQDKHQLQTADKGRR